MRTENNPHGFNHSFPWIYEAEQGKYVEWEDYARLKAEVERLTKAGKLMDTVSEEWERIQKGTSGGCDIMYAVRAWNAVKEGKQP